MKTNNNNEYPHTLAGYNTIWLCQQLGKLFDGKSSKVQV